VDIVRVASFILGNVGGGKFQGSWLPQFDFSHMNCNLVREYYKQELVAKRLRTVRLGIQRRKIGRMKAI